MAAALAWADSDEFISGEKWAGPSLIRQGHSPIGGPAIINKGKIMEYTIMLTLSGDMTVEADSREAAEAKLNQVVKDIDHNGESVYCGDFVIGPLSAIDSCLNTSEIADEDLPF
ncbi:hypothetical protein C4J81_16570 [Deltaproteobacteria bacterium Smac51]|nr:hypothetical protein C4J81_16570 [Deltaproteobacteria bacterium Smac51]